MCLVVLVDDCLSHTKRAAQHRHWTSRQHVTSRTRHLRTSWSKIFNPFSELNEAANVNDIDGIIPHRLWLFSVPVLLIGLYET